MGNLPQYSFGILEKKVTCRIIANGSWATPILVGSRGTNATIAGAGNAMGCASVAQTAAGKFTITLDDTYLKLVGVQATYSGSGDAEDLYAQGGIVSNLATPGSPITVVIKTKTGAANTNPGTTDVNTYINVHLEFEDSSA